MFARIVELENALDSLLPRHRLKGVRSQELRNASIEWSNAVWKAAENLGALNINSEQLIHAKKLSKRGVFICGVHRSGTTLVRDLLDGHPALSVLPSEGSYITNLEPRLKWMQKREHQSFMGKEWLSRLANPINQSPYWLLGRSSIEQSSYVLFARYFMAWWEVANRNFSREISLWPLMAITFAYSTCQRGVKESLSEDFWVDKTPTNERFLPRLWKEMPEAKIIQVVRNPVAVLRSRKRMQPTLNMHSFLRDLKMSFQVAVDLSRQNNSRYMLIRYEELCAAPHTVINKLATFLEVESLPSLMHPTVAGMPSQANSSFNSDLPTGRILAAQEHSHNEAISACEYELLAAHVGDLSKMLDYPMTSLGAWRTGLIKMKFRLW